MKLIGLEAIYPRPRTNQKATEHKIYPYLLKRASESGLECGHDLHPHARAFIYLEVNMDLCSRYVLAWTLSNTLARFFCLEEANIRIRIVQIIFCKIRVSC